MRCQGKFCFHAENAHVKGECPSMSDEWFLEERMKKYGTAVIPYPDLCPNGRERGDCYRIRDKVLLFGEWGVTPLNFVVVNFPFGNPEEGSVTAFKEYCLRLKSSVEAGNPTQLRHERLRVDPIIYFSGINEPWTPAKYRFAFNEVFWKHPVPISDIDVILHDDDDAPGRKYSFELALSPPSSPNDSSMKRDPVNSLLQFPADFPVQESKEYLPPVPETEIHDEYPEKEDSFSGQNVLFDQGDVFEGTNPMLNRPPTPEKKQSHVGPDMGGYRLGRGYGSSSPTRGRDIMPDAFSLAS